MEFWSLYGGVLEFILQSFGVYVVEFWSLYCGVLEFVLWIFEVYIVKFYNNKILIL